MNNEDTTKIETNLCAIGVFAFSNGNARTMITPLSTIIKGRPPISMPLKRLTSEQILSDFRYPFSEVGFQTYDDVNAFGINLGNAIPKELVDVVLIALQKQPGMLSEVLSRINSTMELQQRVVRNYYEAAPEQKKSLERAFKKNGLKTSILEGSEDYVAKIEEAAKLIAVTKSLREQVNLIPQREISRLAISTSDPSGATKRAPEIKNLSQRLVAIESELLEKCGIPEDKRGEVIYGVGKPTGKIEEFTEAHAVVEAVLVRLVLAVKKRLDDREQKWTARPNMVQGAENRQGVSVFGKSETNTLTFMSKTAAKPGVKMEDFAPTQKHGGIDTMGMIELRLANLDKDAYLYAENIVAELSNYPSGSLGRRVQEGVAYASKAAWVIMLYQRKHPNAKNEFVSDIEYMKEDPSWKEQIQKSHNYASIRKQFRTGVDFIAQLKIPRKRPDGGKVPYQWAVVEWEKNKVRVHFTTGDVEKDNRILFEEQGVVVNFSGVTGVDNINLALEIFDAAARQYSRSDDKNKQLDMSEGALINLFSLKKTGERYKRAEAKKRMDKALTGLQDRGALLSREKTLSGYSIDPQPSIKASYRTREEAARNKQYFKDRQTNWRKRGKSLEIRNGEKLLIKAINTEIKSKGYDIPSLVSGDWSNKYGRQTIIPEPIGNIINDLPQDLKKYDK